VDIGSFFSSVNAFDLVAALFLFGMFVLGFVQGTIRRLLGLAAILFSFLFACAVRDPLGSFLGSNWTTYPPEYSTMIGFLTVFVAAAVAFTVVIQGFYRKQPLFKKYTIVDEVIGGILGVIEGLFLILILVVIFDSFFASPQGAPFDGEIPWLRSIFEFYDNSAFAELMRTTFIPAFISVFGLFIPADIHEQYGG
jgi:uncharacterized membrane protein required for colicin V production